MKYALLIHESNEVFDVRQDPAKAPAYWGAYTAFGQALTEAGVMTGGAGLQVPETATTLRKHNGQNMIQDGPFADTKEQLAGFYLIDVADLDAAMEWAARCPAISQPMLFTMPCNCKRTVLAGSLATKAASPSRNAKHP